MFTVSNTGRRIFERVEGEAGVTVGKVDEQVERVVVEFRAEFAEATLLVVQRANKNAADIVVAQRLQPHHARSGEQGTVDFERWILSRGADQDDRAVLDVRKNRVLLGLVEAMDFVDEEHRALTVHPQVLVRFLDGIAQILHAARDRA